MKTLNYYHVYLSCCHLRFECKETEHLPWVVSANYLPGDNHTHKYLFPSPVSRPTEWKDEQRRPSSMAVDSKNLGNKNRPFLFTQVLVLSREVDSKQFGRPHEGSKPPMSDRSKSKQFQSLSSHLFLIKVTCCWTKCLVPRALSLGVRSITAAASALLCFRIKVNMLIWCLQGWSLQ
ncbi:uncharacterized protein CLUP02_03763 [Colletotrichum lupini]|uniref:Uncharacterized protein n=1 Tax=Colletotrichum lupini TaxID=145971 RepID=A0A9Q8SJ38_9PEZI|nr:uncharacterized protein CLUP02_03763 [Colletotrichum lupini]UQC78286.1 hypothetical protein CLUP02_03763 [Colletotrichum lupini]